MYILYNQGVHLCILERYQDTDTYQYPRLCIGWVSRVRLDGIRIPNENLTQHT